MKKFAITMICLSLLAAEASAFCGILGRSRRIERRSARAEARGYSFSFWSR